MATGCKTLVILLMCVDKDSDSQFNSLTQCGIFSNDA